MDTKEEVLEEINDVEEINEEITPDKKIEEVVVPTEEPAEMSISNDAVVNEPVVQINEDDNNISEIVKETSEDKPLNNQEKEVVKEKKSKAPLIVILSILLALDIAALVIYIIGIDKVLGFIK